jgi:hypothetical protein
MKTTFNVKYLFIYSRSFIVLYLFLKVIGYKYVKSYIYKVLNDMPKNYEHYEQHN